MTCRFLFLPVLLPVLAAGDGPLTLEFLPAETSVTFTLGAALHTVHGSFRLKRGTVTFDPATGAASGEIVVDAASGNSENQSRDRRMHGSVLESVLYPEISFRPERVEGTVAASGLSHVVVRGQVGIHGSRHEVALPVDVDAAPGRWTTSATLTVPYVKWGMKDPSTFLLRVRDQVQVHIRATATVRGN